MGCGVSSKSRQAIEPAEPDQPDREPEDKVKNRSKPNKPDLQAVKNRVNDIRSQLDSGYLFCDKQFPANINSIFYNSSNMANMSEAKNVVWKRAKVRSCPLVANGYIFNHKNLLFLKGHCAEAGSV